jgi:hypothetical protein
MKGRRRNCFILFVDHLDAFVTSRLASPPSLNRLSVFVKHHEALLNMKTVVTSLIDCFENSDESYAPYVRNAFIFLVICMKQDNFDHKGMKTYICGTPSFTILGSPQIPISALGRNL